jgi:putative addiction module component (TIGR02574 family)
MTKAARDVLSAAMTLSESERADVAAQLLDTLDSAADPDYARAWEAELLNRIREIDEGSAELIPWEDARRMIRRGSADGEAD